MPACPGATSLANATISVVFLELKQHKLSIANQVWARVESQLNFNYNPFLSLGTLGTLAHLNMGDKTYGSNFT